MSRAIRLLSPLKSSITSTTVYPVVRTIHTTTKMSQNFKQADHKLLVYVLTLSREYVLTCRIPGPIEFSDQVLYANATPGTSHVSPSFIPVFGECLTLLRKVLYAEKEGNQPFLIAGSGTMGWDAVGANLIERGEEALVLNTGYFGDAFADWQVFSGSFGYIPY